MYLDHLTCTGFRCLQKIDFEPGPRINLVRGGNAQGKTSLLEAIFFAATSKSHRTNVEGELAAAVSGSLAATIDPFVYSIRATVRGDGDPDKVQRILDEEIDRLLQTVPTEG
ncbi:MAG: AAA family ATPase [Candidatus Hydrogenedentes bacterium]|nr:AAA family ATPase [Candidatus Hydrogenedentota bacterium]